jgi:hypothetical protein
LFAVAQFAASSALASSQDQVCTSAQLKTMGSLCARHAKCWSVATATDQPNACVEAEVEAKPLAKVQAIEAKYECLAEGQEAFDDETAELSNALSGLHDALDPGAAGDGCGARKILAVGKYCRSMLRCEAASAKDATLEAPCENKALEKLGRAFEKADTLGTCTATGDADASRAAVDPAIQHVSGRYFGLLNPGTTTTTTTATSTTYPNVPCAGVWTGSYSGELADPPATIGGTLYFIVDGVGTAFGTAEDATYGSLGIDGAVDLAGAIFGTITNGTVWFDYSGTLSDCEGSGTGGGTLNGNGDGSWSASQD